MRVTFSIPGKPQRWMRPNQGTDGEGRSVRYTDKQAEAAKAEIARLARIAFKSQGVRPTCGPVLLGVRGIFGIPPSWPRAIQKAAAEGRVLHVADPDLDQLVKLVQDALVGIAYIDDNQVAGYHPAPAKRYGAPERTEVIVEFAAQAEDEKTPGQRRLEKRVAVDGLDKVLAPSPRRANTPKAGSQVRMTAAEYRALHGKPATTPASKLR